MKKAISVLILLAIVFSLAACGEKRIYTSEEDYLSKVSEMREKEESSSKQFIEDVSQDQENLEQEVGKSEKNKQLILKYTYGGFTQYEISYFNKDGILDYRETYKYFHSDDYYKDIKEQGNIGNDKLIKTDDNIRLLVYKNKDLMEFSYDDLYKKAQNSAAEICEIIE